MNTHPTEDPREGGDPPQLQPNDITLVVPLAPEEAAPAAPDSYYIQDNDPEESGISAPFARPFQLSTGMPVVQSGPLSPPAAPKKKKAAVGQSPFIRIAIAAALVVAALGFLWLTVFAQPMQPLSPTTSTAQPTLPPRPTVIVHHPTPKAKPTPQPPIPPAGDWIPQQLPVGWTAAGLTNADALFAERTAWTFTDREEGLDFRNVGTRAQHGGTFTASVFILSPGGVTRFFHNDVRAVNNTLFDHVQQVHLVQAAVNAVPSLIQFQTQGQEQFALVDVSYQLYQSQRDPATGQRTEGLEMDPATHQPRTHHMSVLLVRRTPGTQGPNAPMGGTGWVVSSYGLDVTSPLAITQPI